MSKDHVHGFTGSAIDNQRFVQRARRGILVLVMVGLIPLLAGRASAVFTCKQGCKKASNACAFAGVVAKKGCGLTCQATYDASNHDLAARAAYDACKATCIGNGQIARAACAAALDSCTDGCAANLTCAPSCGNTLGSCAVTVNAVAHSCTAACPLGVGGCFSGCGASASAALANCYNNASNGFAICMAGGCTAVCGNGFVEPGEQCDDNGTSPGDGCSATCTNEDPDVDLILDDGSASGVVGDAPCTGGATAGCDDNCPYQANPLQEDADSDGIGDVCDYDCATGTSGALIQGGVYENTVLPANAVEGTQVAACTAGGACCSHTTTDAAGAYQFANLIPGSYQISAYPPGNLLPSGAGPIAVSGTQTANQDIIVNAPIPAPADTTIGIFEDASGIPYIRPGQAEPFTVTGCVGGSLSWVITQFGNTLAFGGPITDSPDGIYSGTIPPNSFSTSDPNHLTFTIDCPNPDPDETIDFDVYIDPSGFTRFLNGSGAAGATVTLLRSETPVGPFTIVPDGSAIMSPKNRNNPDVSDATGHFGWDVIAGYYQVRAEISGCVVESAVMQIPPAVTDLELVFTCPCVSGPRPSCRSASKGGLTIKNHLTDDTKDTFVWRWSKGQTTVQADFGSPLTTTDYDVCVYSGATNTLLSALTVPADPINWIATGTLGTKGYKYRDTTAMSSGVRKVVLTATTPRSLASLVVRGKGIELPDATLGGLPVPITVQLQRGDSNLCFESTFDLNDVTTNDVDKLKAKVQ